MIELSKYTFDTLRNGKEFNLYRGWSANDKSQILMLSPVADYPAPEILKRLEHEYALREELDPAWAARPIEIARYWDRPVLVLEDPGGVPLDQLLGQPLDLNFSLRAAVGLSSAIDRLHQRGLIHKDIKPANVLVNSISGRCWLRGFGIASRLPRERQSAESPELIAGTLAYMAPEQTGRMNRSIDSRSDLYSLGVTLYQMLTGSLPFTAADPMEWLHCHIARKPLPPQKRSTRVPAPVCAIVMKLLAKTAEERYQTAAGVTADLEHCLAEWETEGRIDGFPLGEHDVPDRLLIPERLYGRTREIAALVTSFGRVVASGGSELVLVSGYSGIGKSSVVNELHKALVPSRGLFASGKFDQYKRDIPYSTVAQAFQGLIRPLLGKDDTELSQWRDAFREALGPNGQLIVDLIPELGLILGQQPPVPELAPQDAQRRFQLVFRRFINVFARPEHPLALFLDDLQWLDAASLDLLEDLSTQSGVQHLMLIGAYRDNEVNSSHPLMRKLEAIRQAGAIVQDIILAPLTREDLAQLIADSLHCEQESSKATEDGPMSSRPSESVPPLAQLVHGKTGGNPFFAIQFLSALAEEGLLTFDHSQGRWSWDLNRIQAQGYTDNVVDLMVGKLTRLPVETQKALKEFACLGHGAEITTLSVVHGLVLRSQADERGLLPRTQASSAFQATARPQEQSRATAERRRDGEGGTSEAEVHSDLWQALRLEFIVRLDGSYKFAHDRIQEAAYSLIPEELRAEAHLRIGRLLRERTPPEKQEEAVFEIVNQLNRGALLINSRAEREQLAELNLLAGKRARASTAYLSALKYFMAGASLLPSDSWARRHELAFALEVYRAECEFLTGELAVAEERLTMLSSRAANTVERANVECLRIDLYANLDQTDRAVSACLNYLRHLRIEWSAHPTQEEARREYERIWSELGSRTIEELSEVPLMSDPESLATLDVLTKVYPSALFTDANLLSMTVCLAVNLSLERGNSDGSCVAYVWLGKIAGPQFGDYKAGFRFGQLGYELVAKRGLERFQARTYLWFAQFVVPWTKHVQASRELIRQAFESATKTGDLAVTVYSFDNLNTNFLAAGDPLIETQRQAERGLELAERARFGHVIDEISAQLGLIRTLRGLTSQFGSFDDGQFDELGFERHLADHPTLALAECWYWIRKLQARFFAGDYPSALDAAERARKLLWISAAIFETAEYHFYAALARAAVYDTATSSFAKAAANRSDEDLSSEALAKEEHFRALTEHHKQLALWAENCPENFENRAVLVGAEIARIEGRALDAMDLYEQAIRSAQVNGFVHNEALANELAARFYVARGFEKIAHAYLRDARYGYLRWGADGKVRQLDNLYPYLKGEAPAVFPTPVRHSRSNEVAANLAGGDGRSTITTPVEQLDLGTVIKVSQAVSGEVVLDKLIDTLMRTAIEQAGAERGLLILLEGIEHRIAAEAATSADTVVVGVPEKPAAGASVPDSIIHYVARTHESVILDDASAQHPFSADAYFRQQNTRSILCLPLINQAKLIAVLYLENNLAPNIFTPARMTVLKLLAAQAAISLENTRLYRDVAEREAALRRTQADLAHVSRVTTMGELAASIAHEVNQPLVGVVTNASAGLRYLSWDSPNLVEAKEAIRAIIRDGNRAADVVSRMRALFKKARPTKEPLDINEAIEEVVLLTQGEARRNKVMLQVELAANLPAAMADRVQIQQVLMNLILNAIQAMSTVEGRDRVLIVKTGRGEGDEVRVAIQDCGIGIDPQNLDRIFDAFHTTKPGGMGMGLSISRSIVESHGGRLWATPNDGPGVTFQFTV